MIRIAFATSSNFKKEEHEIFVKKVQINGKNVNTLFELEVREIDIPEILEVDIGRMVEHEAKLAYQKLKVPCFVEHAGLIFEEYIEEGYPGGLTKPMYNSLGENFISETNSKNRKAIARAVVGYCDGVDVKHFVGETEGIISEKPHGDRKFYWDTIFIPISPSNTSKKTYAEIVEDIGLEEKIVNYSQSTKAKIDFLKFVLKNQTAGLWK